MWSTLKTIPQRHPFLFSVGLTTIKTGGVDYCVQKYSEKKEEIDWRRVRVFLAFGFAFNGCWQYFVFTKFMPYLVPNAARFAAKPLAEKMKDMPGVRGVFIQNMVENGFNNPICFFPAFYCVKEYIEDGTFADAMRKYKSHWKEDLLSIWALWVPAQFINLSFSPLWFRIPFMAAVSVAWTSYISITKGNKEQ